MANSWTLLMLLILASCHPNSNQEDIGVSDEYYQDFIADFLSYRLEGGVEEHIIHHGLNDSAKAKAYFDHALVLTDTVSNFRFQKIEYGYNHSKFQYGRMSGIDGWVIQDLTSGRKTTFINLLNTQIKRLELYGGNLSNIQNSIDLEVLPDYERRIQKVINDLNINSIDRLKIVLGEILGRLINYPHELQLKSFLYDASEVASYGSKYLDIEDLKACKKAMNSNFSDCTLYKELCDLYETKTRGIYQIFYKEDEMGLSVDIDLLLLECNFANVKYTPASGDYEMDSLLVESKKKLRRPPKLRERLGK